MGGSGRGLLVLLRECNPKKDCCLVYEYNGLLLYQLVVGVVEDLCCIAKGFAGGQGADFLGNSKQQIAQVYTYVCICVCMCGCVVINNGAQQRNNGLVADNLRDDDDEYVCYI